MQDFLSLNVPFTPGNNSSSNSYQRGQSLIFRQPLILSTRFRQWSLPRDKLCNMNFSTLSCTSNSPARVSYRLLPINSVVLYLQISSIRISIQWPELEPGLILRLGFRRGCAPPPAILLIPDHLSRLDWGEKCGGAVSGRGAAAAGFLLQLTKISELL